MCYPQCLNQSRGESGESQPQDIPKTSAEPQSLWPIFCFVFQKPQKQLVIRVCKTFLKIMASQLTFYTADKGLSDLVPSKQDKSLSERTEARVKMQMEMGPRGGSQPPP